MKYTIPKGLFDIVPHESKEEDLWRSSEKWQYVEGVLRSISSSYGFKEIRTPIFENTDLFIRSVGESSDIVSKEMYTFHDKSDRSMTLRPEGTAAALRAYCEKKLYQAPGCSKLYYIGPMFRYERPQAGRYRQHHQFGAEALGIGSPEQDVEMIDFLLAIYRKLGLHNLTVHLNSVGDEVTRSRYREALHQFLLPHFDHLSEESQVRFSKNILRILDSKSLEDKEILKGAPSILDFLSEEAKEHFEKVKALLTSLKIPFLIDHKLVRGLDYYNKTVFEIISHGLGAQNTIGAGGRYDGLLESIGGPALPSVGFATGLERVLQTMHKEKAPFPETPHLDLFFIPMGKEAREACFKEVTTLRHLGWKVDLDLSGKKIQHGLQLANSLNAPFCIIVGDDELKSSSLEIKDMKNRSSSLISWSEIASFLTHHIAEQS
ncbi:histidine--tRNA ligase [Rhabdochlamydiaceae symbiont of Dictyostelium giganteum]|uniref:histidine--tRNA ligase n=1 Tax=Rhabdochlamydiaceae symbiont of Dictyostelium giganteum TaxID=3342349 RepID=UPI003850FA4E